MPTNRTETECGAAACQIRHLTRAKAEMPVRTKAMLPIRFALCEPFSEV